jgi:cytochrome c
VKTVGSFWPYATTLFDYVRRAMPANAPRSLSNDEVYEVCAYILQLNGIIDESAVMSAQTLAKVQMPNRDGFVPFSPQK